MPTRREICLALLAAALAARPARAGRLDDAPPLRARAAARGRQFGSAVQAAQLADPHFAAVLRREAALVTPEYELKWASVRPTPGAPRFEPVDRLLAWCDANGLAMRGHALVWHEAMPAWLPRFPDAATARRLIADHVALLVGRYAGRLESWDVVNEPVEPRHGRADGLRVTPWQAALGSDYIVHAFRAAAAADPGARLYLNEYGLDFETPEDLARRRATLALLEGLRRRDVPCHALGIQAHLAPGKRFDPTRFAAFLDAVAALGCVVTITELDVTDHALPADAATRDAAVAAVARDYLAVACAHPAVTGVLTWGLSDRHSWLNADPWYRRPDGLEQRALPLDRELARKPLWEAIGAAFDRAPSRPARAAAVTAP